MAILDYAITMALSVSIAVLAALMFASAVAATGVCALSAASALVLSEAAAVLSSKYFWKTSLVCLIVLMTGFTTPV